MLSGCSLFLSLWLEIVSRLGSFPVVCPVLTTDQFLKFADRVANEPSLTGGLAVNTDFTDTAAAELKAGDAPSSPAQR